MQRYIWRTLQIITISVIITLTCLVQNHHLSLSVAEDESVKNEKSQQNGEKQHEHSEDDGHIHQLENLIILSDQAKSNIGIKTAETDIRGIEKVVEVTGNIIAHPGRQSVVTPKIGGIVKRIHYNLGDYIKKGDVLLELESIDLQLGVIDLIEAVNQKKSLDETLEKQKTLFSKQIQLELQTRQIDYLASLSQLQECQSALDKFRAYAETKTISALEQMRVDLVKTDIEYKLLAKTLERIEVLTEKRISAQKELISHKAEFMKANNDLKSIKRKFQLLNISNETLQLILEDDGSTPILTLLNGNRIPRLESTSAQVSYNALKYVSIIDDVAELIEKESAYNFAVIRLNTNKQRAIAAGLSEKHLNAISKSDTISSFKEYSKDELIEEYSPFMTSSEALEALLQTEAAQRSADIFITKAQQKLKVLGLSQKEIDEVMEKRSTISNYYVTSPSSGQIVTQDVKLGATVEKNDSLYSILNADIVWVEGEAYEDILSELQIGIDVRIRVSSYPQQIFKGKISQISAVVDSEKRTVHFWTEVDNHSHQLKPGMFADQTLVIEKIEDVLSVPVKAVLEDGPTRIVFVESGNTYTKHEVVVGMKDDQYIEIKEGLLAGELVVVQGTHQLKSATADTNTVLDPHAGHNH